MRGVRPVRAGQKPVDDPHAALRHEHEVLPPRPRPPFRRPGRPLSARATVVPTAITRPPPARVASTWRAVDAGTRNLSGYGASPASSDDTPV